MGDEQTLLNYGREMLVSCGTIVVKTAVVVGGISGKVNNATRGSQK